MKPNVKLSDKSKNSFIYFQLGLIAVMITVLFALEFNFKEENKIYSASSKISLPDDIIFTYNPKIESKIETKKVVVSKPVAKVNVPKIINEFKETKEEVNDEIIKESAHQESNTTNENSSESNNESSLESSNGNGEKENEVFVVVEFLPRFPSCINVSTNSQKDCFDTELQKEIFKHLKYPAKDLENKKEGTVFVQFVVDEKGNFTSVKTVENNRATNDMRAAVENAVKKLPKIIPAKQGDRNVKVIYTIPISFKIK